MGQSEALAKVDLLKEEWVRQVKAVIELENKEEEGITYSRILKERPVIACLLVGEFGTGKSLLIKILGEGLKEEYQKLDIRLKDVMASANRINKFKPNIRYISPGGAGRKLVDYAEILETQKEKNKNIGILGALGGIIAIGFSLIALGARNMVLNMIGGMTFERALVTAATSYFYIGVGLIGMPMFLLFWLFMMRNPTGTTKQHPMVPQLLVDRNPETMEYYKNVTVVSDAALFGEIEWDALQGNLGIPPHQRTFAGAVHDADKVILYVDEGRNLSASQIIKLLTVMEDGEMPIQAQSNTSTLSGGGTGGATAGQNVMTPPVKAMFFLFIAVNLDFIFDKSSLFNQIPAFRDRIENYGDIIMMKDEIPAGPLNEMMVCQVVRDEIYRFGFPPMEAQGFHDILDYVKTRASDKNHMKIMFRAVIKVIKKSAQLAWTSGDTRIKESHVRTAIEDYTSTIETQVLENAMSKTMSATEVQIKGKEFGQVNGLSVLGADSYHEGAGDVMQVQAYVKLVDDPKLADYVHSGIVHGDDKDVTDSIKDVRTAILRIYGIDLKTQAYTHIKFSGTRIDGPSAGVTMTISLMSSLGDPDDFKRRLVEHLKAGGKLSEFELYPVPLKQNIAMTGAMEIKEVMKGDIKVSAIGGIIAKIRGANRYGIRYVIMPKINYDHKIVDVNAFNGTIPLYGNTVREYFEQVRADKEDTDESIKAMDTDNPLYRAKKKAAIEDEKNRKRGLEK